MRGAPQYLISPSSSLMSSGQRQWWVFRSMIDTPLVGCSVTIAADVCESITPLSLPVIAQSLPNHLAQFIDATAEFGVLLHAAARDGDRAHDRGVIAAKDASDPHPGEAQELVHHQHRHLPRPHDAMLAARLEHVETGDAERLGDHVLDDAPVRLPDQRP